MNVDDVVARATDGQSSSLLVCAEALRQIPSMPLAVQSIVRMKAVLDGIAVAKAQHIVSRR